MIRTLALLIYMSFSTALMADALPVEAWKRLGVRFEAETTLFNARKSELQKSSGEIADLISTVLAEFPNEISKDFDEKKLLIIFAKNASTDAVFYPPGELRKTSDFIITVNPSLIESPSFERLLAHEIFHAVHFTFNPDELDWIREGMAQLFESRLYGGFNQAHVVEALTKSNFPLEAEFDINSYQKEKYGNTFLFFYFLSTHCDPQRDLLFKMIQNGLYGRAGIDSVLANSPLQICSSFAKAAEGFSVAKMVNAYSGTNQSAETFIIPAMQEMGVDPTLEASYTWNKIGSFQPKRISKARALILSATSPADAHFWGLEKRFPNRVKRLIPSEISGLKDGWDIGIIRTR